MPAFRYEKTPAGKPGRSYKHGRLKRIDFWEVRRSMSYVNYRCCRSDNDLRRLRRTDFEQSQAFQPTGQAGLKLPAEFTDPDVAAARSTFGFTRIAFQMVDPPADDPMPGCTLTVEIRMPSDVQRQPRQEPAGAERAIIT